MHVDIVVLRTHISWPLTCLYITMCGRLCIPLRGLPGEKVLLTCQACMLLWEVSKCAMHATVRIM